MGALAGAELHSSSTAQDAIGRSAARASARSTAIPRCRQARSPGTGNSGIPQLFTAYRLARLPPPTNPVDGGMPPDPARTMNKQAPSIGQLITLSGFVLACFGLLLFVWVAFGGPTPLAASGYKLTLPMTQIGQLAEQSQIKISGVEVGRVSGVELGEGDQDAEAIVELEIDPEYAPVPEDTRAILRAKSLLGEAYVELTPGDPRDGMLPDGGELPAAQVAKSVQLDEIFRTFDPETQGGLQAGRDRQLDRSLRPWLHAQPDPRRAAGHADRTRRRAQHPQPAGRGRDQADPQYRRRIQRPE